MRVSVVTTPDERSGGVAPEFDRGQARLTATVVAAVVFLTAIAPLATDLYVPAFPRVAAA